MNAKATVRVRTPDAQLLPARTTMERAAELLRQSGFHILRIGRVGISIEADVQLFQEELGIDIQGRENLVAKPSPRGQELSRLIDLLEITGTPLSFQ